MPVASLPTYDLALHRARLEERGYDVLPGFMEPQLVARLRQHIDQLLGPPATTPGGAVRELRHPITGDILAEILYREPLIALAMDELGITARGDLRLLEQVLIRTDPAEHGGGPGGWHIDMAFAPEDFAATPKRTYYHHVQALSDVAPGGGSFMIVPGSHRLTYAAAAGLDAEGLKRLHADPAGLAGVDLTQGIEVTARSGDLIVFNPMCVHAGSVNRTSQPRYVYFSSFGDISAQRLWQQLKDTNYRKPWPSALIEHRPAELAKLLEL
ncbi:MAG: phytanoyl-CoA dioxygenase family protein [Planctomycetes bacterium]|nr:phytanoyl-CoA dioxygenase family protein [Planctomycetota bacterium]